MSDVIPKGKTAFEKYEMASFDEKPNREVRAVAAEETARSLQAAAEIAQLKEAAQREGYAAGLEQGKQQAFEETRALLQGQARRLAQLAETFAGALHEADAEMADSIVELTLDIAKGLLKSSLQVKPELVRPVVADAIRSLTEYSKLTLALHPEDVALLDEQMQTKITDSGWRIIEDHTIERGGCKVQTSTNQVDATLPARWQQIAAAFGKSSCWDE